jgi:hypothetical protein
MANVALCVLVLRVPVPKTIVPFLKVTVPVGDPPNPAVTVVVKVTVFPLTEGFKEGTTVVVVFALLTVCVSIAEALVLKLPSPE